MVEKLVLLHAEPPRLSDSTSTVGAQVTDLTGPLRSNMVLPSECSKKLSTKDLFDPCLFLEDESINNWNNYGKLNSPPKIGIAPHRFGYWLEQPSANPIDWSRIFDGPKGSESTPQQCVEVEPISSLPVEQSQPDKIGPRVGAGMTNLGNSCFMNAVLQCFLHTVPLVHGVLSDIRGNCAIQGYCALCAFRELIDLSFSTEVKLVQPWAFFGNLSEFSESFVSHRQEDAHEFLQCLLNKLDSCYGENGGHSQSENLVKQVFRGGLLSKLKCLKCGHCSDTYEPSLDLSLEIESANDLKTAIQSFTNVEKIDGKVDCIGCKQKEPAEKQLTLHKVPSVVIFHLKRFKNDGTVVQKIDKHVAFPLELDLLPFTVSGKSTDAELKYRLHAVIVHAGPVSSSGHYCCFICLAPNMWYRFNDTEVVEVREGHVLSQEAYILFYAKEGTSSFSSYIDKLPDKQVLLPVTETETSPLPVLLRNIDASFASIADQLNAMQGMTVSPCPSDCSDEVCNIQSDMPSPKRPLQKLSDDPETETLKIGSTLASRGIGEGSRKKPRNDDT